MNFKHAGHDFIFRLYFSETTSSRPIEQIFVLWHTCYLLDHAFGHSNISLCSMHTAVQLLSRYSDNSVHVELAWLAYVDFVAILKLEIYSGRCLQGPL